MKARIILATLVTCTPMPHSLAYDRFTVWQSYTNIHRNFDISIIIHSLWRLGDFSVSSIRRAIKLAAASCVSMAPQLSAAEQKIVLRVVSKKGASPLDAVRKVNQ